jgi:hypothetical protein
MDEETFEEKKMNIDENNDITSSVKVISKSYPRTTSTYVYKAGYCSIGEKDNIPCVIKMFLPQNVKVACSLGEHKIRVDRAKVVGIFPFQFSMIPYRDNDTFENSDPDEIRWKDLIYTDDLVTEATGWMFKNFKYVVGEEIIDEKYDPDLSKTCVPGIHANFTQEEAFLWHGLVNVVPSLVNGYEYVENFSDDKPSKKND